jgi:hypothetical protein
VVAVGTVAVLLLHGLLVWPAHGYLLSDTTGYLADARWLAGKAASTWQGPNDYYHFGWSLLVAPLYLVFASPRAVQLGALTLNAGLAAAILPAGYLLARRAFALPRRLAFAAGGVAVTYPAVLLLAGYEWGEALFQLLFVGFVLAATFLVHAAGPGPAACTKKVVGWASVVAVLAAALNATHPRGLGVVAVTGVFLLALGWRDRRVLVGLGVLVVAFAASRQVDRMILDAIYAPRSAGVEGDVLRRMTEPRLVWGAVKATVGQLWYLSVATLGLAPLGALWLATSRRVPRPLALVTLGAVLATLAASAVFMSDGTRVDHMVYGRYLEGTVPVLLVAGAAAVAAWRTVLVRLLAGVAGLVVALAVVLVAVRGGDLFTGNVMPLNVTGILVYRTTESQVDVARVTLLALLLTGGVLAAARWRALAGLALAAALFAGTATSVQTRTLRPFDERWAGFTHIPEVVRRVSDGGALSYDLGSYDLEAANLYQLELSDRDVRFTRGQPTTDLVIAAPTWEHDGARLVFVEPATGPYADQALWVRPGDLQDRLVRRGEVLADPTQFSAPLPAAAFDQRVEVAVPPTVRGTRTVEVRVTHTGAGAAWPPVGVLPGVVHGTVRLGARWFVGADEVKTDTAELDRVLLPGESDELELELVAPPPGRYRVEIGLRQEGIAWFPRPATFTVEVR